MAKDAYYFPHDSNAKDDPKIILLIEQLGLEGYGIFWVLIETLRDQTHYKYPLALLPALARRFNTTHDKMKIVVTGYGLFTVIENEFFFSESLIKRMSHLEYKREMARIAGKKSAEKRSYLNSGSTDVQRTFNEGSTIKVKYSKEEDSKVNKSKEEDSKDDGFSEIIIFYQNNIGLIKDFTKQEICSFLDDGIETDLLLETLKYSLTKNDPWSYTRKILINCLNSNVKTIEQFNAKRLEHQKLNKSIKDSSNKPRNSGNFQQREYDNEYFESLYENTVKSTV